jgi:hypothetical protein
LTVLGDVDDGLLVGFHGNGASVEFLVVTHDGDLVLARGKEQFLVPIPVVVEFVHVSDEVIHFLAVQKDGGLTLGLKLDHQVPVRSGNLVTVSLEVHDEVGGLSGGDGNALGEDFVAVIHDNHSVIAGGEGVGMAAFLNGLAIHKKVALRRGHL